MDWRKGGSKEGIEEEKNELEADGVMEEGMPQKRLIATNESSNEVSTASSPLVCTSSSSPVSCSISASARLIEDDNDNNDFGDFDDFDDGEERCNDTMEVRKGKR